MGAAAFFVGGAVTAPTVSAKKGTAGVNLGFSAIDTDTTDEISLPDGYSGQPFAAWGEPINGISPRFKSDASN